MQYIATINTPGYLPDSGDIAVFDTATEAWEYLWDERNRHIEETYDGEADPDGNPWGEDECLDILSANVSCASGMHANTEPYPGCLTDGTGTVTGPTPGYEGDHDLGLAYTVTAHESVCSYCGADLVVEDCPNYGFGAEHA